MEWTTTILLAAGIIQALGILWVVFLGSVTFPEKWQDWQRKIQADPRPVLWIALIVNVLLGLLTAFLLFYSLVFVYNLLPATERNDGGFYIFIVAWIILGAPAIIWILYFVRRVVSLIRTRLSPSPILRRAFRVNIILVLFVSAFLGAGEWYASTHPNDVSVFNSNDVTPLNLESLRLSTVHENLPLSCGCADPVVSASLDKITIPSSGEAIITINFTNPTAEDINLGFGYATLRDLKDENKVYKGDYDSFVVPANGFASVRVAFHLSTSQKQSYIFSMSLVKGSYWMHKYKDVTISF